MTFNCWSVTEKCYFAMCNLNPIAFLVKYKSTKTKSSGQITPKENNYTRAHLTTDMCSYYQLHKGTSYYNNVYLLSV